MIQDLDETLKEILIKHGKISPADVDIAFDQPTSEWTASLSRPTINLYLYDIRENLELRSSQYRVERDDNGMGRRIRPPKRIDLSYLITVWARNPEDEHQLLWRILFILSKFRVIQPEIGIGQVKKQPLEMRTKVALPSEAVRNMPDLWGVMENQLKPSINFQVTASLDIEEEIEAPLVFNILTSFGQKDAMSDRPAFNTLDTTIYHIGGQVFLNDNAAGSGIAVKLLDRGDIVETDPEGRFVFANVLPGEHEVEVTMEGKTPKTFKITVPAKDYNLALS